MFVCSVQYTCDYSRHVEFLRLHYYMPALARVGRGSNSKCTSKISYTHHTHIHTYPSRGGGVSLTEGSCRKGQRELMAGEAYTI